MSIFGDIADVFTSAASSVGDVVGAVESGISDVVHSGIVKGALDFGGGIFGDPGLGDQVAGAFSVADKLFGRGSAHAAPARRIAANNRIGGSLTGRRTSRVRNFGRTVAAAQTYPVKVRGRVVRLTLAQLQRLRSAMALRRPIPVVAISPAPRPPPQEIGSGTANAFLANADEVARAVAAGATITIGGKSIDTTKPVGIPPALASVGADIAAATGLDVVTKQAPVDLPVGGTGRTRNL